MQPTGHCHCGNLCYTIAWRLGTDLVPVHACSCGFCTMHGARWLAHPAAHCALTIIDTSALLRYRFGTRTADFLVCGRCGILTVACCEITTVDYAVINANTFTNLPAGALASAGTNFDGEDTAARLTRRQRNWMPITVTCA